MDCFVASLLAMTVPNPILLAMTLSRRAPHLQPSSPGLTGRSNIPETPMMESKKPRRNDPGKPLITARAIDDVFQRAAGFKAFDLARDIFRYFVGIGIGGVVRRQHDLRMRPEWAVRRKRLVGEDIERRRAERAVVKTSQNVGFVLQSTPPGIDQHRRTQRAFGFEFCQQPAIQDMPRIRRERQQTNKDIGPFQERTELLLAVKAFDAINPLRCPAPPRNAKAYSRQHFGGVRPQRAKTHDSDRDRARRPLKPWLPPLLALARPQVRLLAMVHQYMQHA